MRKPARDRHHASGPGADDTGGCPPEAQFSWRAVVMGIVATLISTFLLAGVGGLIHFSGIGSDLMRSDGGRTLAVVAVISLVIAFAFGSWFAVRVVASNSMIMVGTVAAIVTIVLFIIIATPFVERIADYRSVAIALGISDAPDVGTSASAALHRLVEPVSQDAGSPGDSALETAWTHVRMTLWFAGAVVFSLITAASFGAALGLCGSGFSRMGSAMKRSGVPVLALLGGGVGVLTVLLWPGIWAVYIALFDFDQSAGPDIGVTLSEVSRHPEVMWGETVTVSARVETVVSAHALILGNSKPVIGDRVLVISQAELHEIVLVASQSDAVLGAGDVVQVTGVVRQSALDQLESSTGMTLDKNSLSGYGGQAVLVANAIDIDVPIAFRAGDKEFNAGSSGYDLGVTIDDIIATPEEYVNLTVTVSDEVEESLLTPHAFVLGDRGLLAISKTPLPELFVEATAYVSGEVRFFDLKEIERELGIDLDATALAGFSGQPVILVESLEIVT